MAYSFACCDYLSMLGAYDSVQSYVLALQWGPEWHTIGDLKG